MALFDKLIIFALCKDLDASEIGDAIKDSIPINKNGKQDISHVFDPD
mgnify:CR=1 FL=1